MKQLCFLFCSVFLIASAEAKTIYWAKLRDSVSVNEVHQIMGEVGVRQRHFLNEINWVSFESVKANDITTHQMNKLLSNSSILKVEKDVSYHTFVKENDPKGSPAKWTDVRTAWNFTTGDKRVVVAVIDTGVNLRHEDLVNQIWLNKDEVAGNGIDDDKNGFIDDVNGWNFFSNSNNPNDDHGHGSHVAGIVGAEGNNRIGIAGVNWHVTIMPLKFISFRGSGTAEGGARAILYAADNGAHIINASWGGSDISTVLHDAIEYAGRKGVLFVAAAGNDGKNVERRPMYPAGYDLPSVVSVASGARANQISKFSNYGKTVVDILAPGEAKLSTFKSKLNSYQTMSGTSMASPVVAGVAALMLSVNPNLSVVDLRNGLFNSVQPSRRNSLASGGWVWASKAVNQLHSEKEIWPQRLSIKVGQKFQYTAWGLLGAKSWSPENSAIASVDSNGLVEGLSEGTTQVTLTDAAGNQYKTVYLDVVD